MKNKEKLIELAAVKLCEMHGFDALDTKSQLSSVRIESVLNSDIYKAIAHAQEQLEASQLARAKTIIQSMVIKLKRGHDKNTVEIVNDTLNRVLKVIDSLSDEEVTG